MWHPDPFIKHAIPATHPPTLEEAARSLWFSPLRCGRLELSERSLRRRCHEAFGYGPKRLDRILRFQRFLDLARRARAPGAELAALALAAGYADQAHLSREVRRLSSLSAATVVGQLAVPFKTGGAFLGHEKGRATTDAGAPP